MGCNICDSTGHELDARGFCPFCGSDVDNGLRVLIGGYDNNEMPWTVLADSLEETWNGFQTPVFHYSVMSHALRYIVASMNTGDKVGAFYQFEEMNGLLLAVLIHASGEREYFVPNDDGNYSFAGHGYAWESFIR